VTRHEPEINSGSGNSNEWLGVKTNSKRLLLMGERVDQVTVREKMRITPEVPYGHAVIRCIFIVTSAKKFYCEKNGNCSHSCLQVLMPADDTENGNGRSNQNSTWKREPVLKNVISATFIAPAAAAHTQPTSTAYTNTEALNRNLTTHHSPEDVFSFFSFFFCVLRVRPASKA
jgi:hypothetical protein